MVNGHGERLTDGHLVSMSFRSDDERMVLRGDVLEQLQR